MDPPADSRPLPAVATLARAVLRDLADAALSAVAPLASTARAGAFWTGVLLPFVHVPLLLVAGLTPTTTPLLVALWTLHVVVLAVGARHDPSPDADHRRANSHSTTAGHVARADD